MGGGRWPTDTAHTCVYFRADATLPGPLPPPPRPFVHQKQRPGRACPATAAYSLVVRRGGRRGGAREARRTVDPTAQAVQSALEAIPFPRHGLVEPCCVRRGLAGDQGEGIGEGRGPPPLTVLEGTRAPPRPSIQPYSALRLARGRRVFPAVQGCWVSTIAEGEGASSSTGTSPT